MTSESLTEELAAETGVDAGADAISQDANSADSSDAEQATKEPDAKPASLLDAVKAASKADAAAQSSSEAKTEEKPEALAEQPKVEGEKPEDVPEEKLPFHKHPRWMQMNRALKDLEPKAQAFEKIAKISSDAGLSSEDVDNGFEIMSLIKRDPAKALEALRPIMHALEGITGARLPDDLQQRVVQGRADPETAQELAQARYLQAQQAQRQEHEAVQAQQRAASAMASTVTTLEQQWKATDVDYAKKEKLVIAQTKALLAEYGQPANVEQATQLVSEAKRLVDESLRAMVPARPQVRTLTGGAVAPRATPRPTTLADAVRLAARG
jgi:hypothetical protein